MKLITRWLLLLSLACFASFAHAESGCPEGMIPYSGNDVSSCGPIPPGYYQNKPTPQATPTLWATRWGAIAIDGAAGSVGVSKNMASKADAENQAQMNCASQGGKACKIEVVYDNECGALVAGDTGHNSGADSTSGKAVALGIKTCKESGDTNCHALYSDCSFPERIQ